MYSLNAFILLQLLASSSSFTFPSRTAFSTYSTNKANAAISSIVVNQQSERIITTSLSSSSSSSSSSAAAAAAAAATSSSTEKEETISKEDSIPNEWKGEILSALSTIIDPDLNSDIVSLGFIQNLSLDTQTKQISFDVQLTTPACPIKEEFQTSCEDAVNNLPWTSSNGYTTKVSMTSQDNLPPPGDEMQYKSQTDAPYGLSQVKAIIAVSSCKGGVGKSTTAVNLAYALNNLGASVGIFDADVYGPSLPTMVTPDHDAVNFIGRQIAPLSRNGVKLMSFGYVNEGSAVMRGPMVTQLLDQFLSLTYWGPLDYLVLDMPPGTGDIQLTLSQKLNITAAVIVTTPQELSFVDVERGIEMFDSVNVPCVSVVENMAYLELGDDNDDGDEESNNEIQLDEDAIKNSIVETLRNNNIDVGGSTNDEKITNDLLQVVKESMQDMIKNSNKQKINKEKKQIKIFGQGHKKRLSQQWGIDHTYSVPLMDKIAYNGDNGTPFILEYPDSPQAKTYNDLASSLVREVVKIQYAQENNRPSVAYKEEENVLEFGGILSNEEKEEGLISNIMPSAELRRDCKCAACVEEMTGRQILQPEDIPDSVKPISMVPTGNYALSVDWSDGHKSLYPYRQIRSLLLDLHEGGEKKEGVSVEEIVRA